MGRPLRWGGLDSFVRFGLIMEEGATIGEQGEDWEPFCWFQTGTFIEATLENEARTQLDFMLHDFDLTPDGERHFRGHLWR